MTKFKVGDKIRILDGEKLVGNGNYNVTTGKEYEVISFHKKSEIEIEHIKVADNFCEPFAICDWEYEYIELVGTKPTKNQRITALENEVAELKLIVHELRGKKSIESSTTNTVEDIIEFEGQQYRKVDRVARQGDIVIIRKPADDNRFARLNTPHKVVVDERQRLCVNNPDDALVYNNILGRTSKTVEVYELIQSKPLTPNQQRAAIIEKAKKFVEDLKDEEGKYSKSTVFGNSELIFEFVVNPEKRTVVALGRLFYYPSILKVCAKGIAKCGLNDVFNEHIGKAIALGRALGLDVSEFEQALKPNKVVSGMKIKSTVDWPEAYCGKIYKGDIFEVVSDEVKKPGMQFHVNSAISRNSEIWDDTKAIY